MPRLTKMTTPRPESVAVAARLAASRRVLILSHRNPDGDALGSTLALARGLQHLGKTVDVLVPDAIPAHLTWLEGCGEVLTQAPAPAGYDLLALLDCAALDRTALDAPSPLDGMETVIIDHHPGEAPGRCVLIDPAAAATAELVFDVLRALDAPLDEVTATALYVALETDTGGFRYSNTSPAALKLAARLVEAGANPKTIFSEIHERENPDRLRLLARVLSTLTLSAGGAVADLTATRAMFAETHTATGDTDGFVNYPRSLEGVEVAMLLKELDETTYRLALRSKGRVNVREIAQTLGGGGHVAASGATLKGTPAEIRRRVAALVETALDADSD